ncbi:Trans-aconitate 3-methyltransferase [Rhodotorula toruloides]|uniref:BY PROTMAP: gi/472583098/gb/EMS20752.1/ trans-aconitate 3-methyltransferase [Rhodosporidium toruloides NP11] gi/647397319/emb/CDR40294.1/ RHTO0S05e00870g1_1 [Rhodosporidium toruloides] n=1 Tax=Rhodotorula toruloides TaxID=5286 RepID=A0A0K3CKI3_RHOTO|nr:Trans-aconitate 3-methyltransferase [Rhodotorula toruloides]PRQ74706.1 S-adenosyl-L-methionine-dependent methyltransferase [Rhodotorula toruloides]
MATFAKASFDAAKYAQARPSYPRALFDHVLAYLDQSSSPALTQRPRTLLDLGCGPGVSTFDWLDLDRFERIVGIDPSDNMISAARGILEEKRAKGEIKDGVEVRFEKGGSDNLAGIFEDGSVDLAVAGQAAHWFDAEATYRELARVLKPGGAFAFWGYGEFFFQKQPSLNRLVTTYSSGTLGKYWQQPGRSIVEALLTPFPLPSPSSSPSFDPSSFHRSFFLRPHGPPPPLTLPPLLDPPLPSAEGESATYSLQPATSTTTDAPLSVSITRTILLQRTWTLSQLEAYLRTWSSAHAYNASHRPSSPDSPNAGTGQAWRDCVEVFVDGLRREGVSEEEEGMEVGWEMGVVFGRKRA